MIEAVEPGSILPPVNVTSMTNSENGYPILVIVDLENDPVDADANAVAVLKSLELFHAIRSGRVFE